MDFILPDVPQQPSKLWNTSIRFECYSTTMRLIAIVQVSRWGVPQDENIWIVELNIVTWLVYSLHAHAGWIVSLRFRQTLKNWKFVPISSTNAEFRNAKTPYVQGKKEQFIIVGEGKREIDHYLAYRHSTLKHSTPNRSISPTSSILHTNTNTSKQTPDLHSPDWTYQLLTIEKSLAQLNAPSSNLRL